LLPKSDKFKTRWAKILDWVKKRADGTNQFALSKKSQQKKSEDVKLVILVMENTKELLFKYFEAKMVAALPSVSVAQIRKCADELATVAALEVKNGSRQFALLYNEVSHKSEQHKLLFREHIEFISKHSDVLMEEMERNSFVQVKCDKVTHKKYLVGKTIFANGLIKFITGLNESVRRFYTDVYEIKDEREAKERGFNQTTLF